MKVKIRTQMFALILFVTTLASCTKDSPIESTNIMIAKNNIDVENELLGIVNDYRVSLGTPSLQFSEVAYEYANAHTDYMVSKGNLSHDNFSSRAAKISSKENAKAVAENVAKGYSNAAKAFEGWLNSSSHRTTMEGDFTHTAVCVKKNSDGDYYFTQLFFKK